MLLISFSLSNKHYSLSLSNDNPRSRRFQFTMTVMMPAPIDVRIPFLTLHTHTHTLYAPFRSYLFILFIPHNNNNSRVVLDESCYSIWFSPLPTSGGATEGGCFVLIWASERFAISSAVRGFNFRALRCGSELGWRVWFWFLFCAAARGRGRARAGRGFAWEQSPTHGRYFSCFLRSLSEKLVWGF